MHFLPFFVNLVFRQHPGRSIWLAPLLVFFHGNLTAQQFPVNIRIERFATEQGLYSKDIHEVVQDHRGFIWVGTRDGFARFDGQKFKNYGPERTGIQQGFFISLKIDAAGNVWFYGREKVVQFLDIKTDEIQGFDPFFAGKAPFRGDEIQTVFSNQARDSVFHFFLKNRRMFRYDGQFSEIKPPKNLPGNWLVDFYHSPRQNLQFWVFNFDFIISDTDGNQLEIGKSKILNPSVIYLHDGAHIIYNQENTVAAPAGLPLIGLKKIHEPAQGLVLREEGAPYDKSPFSAISMSPDGSGLIFGGEKVCIFDQRGNVQHCISLPPTSPDKTPPISIRFSGKAAN